MLLVVDANVLVSAVLGRSIDLVLDCVSRGIHLIVPVRMMIEAEKVIEREARLDLREVLGRLALLTEMVEVVGTDHYLAHEQRARDRLDEAGQKDWPVLATSLALGASIWSNDRDLFGTGVAVWSTLNIRFAQAKA
jgi:predicted nucleic acid-binding protein